MLACPVVHYIRSSMRSLIPLKPFTRRGRDVINDEPDPRERGYAMCGGVIKKSSLLALGQTFVYTFCKVIGVYYVTEWRRLYIWRKFITHNAVREATPLAHHRVAFAKTHRRHTHFIFCVKFILLSPGRSNTAVRFLWTLSTVMRCIVSRPLANSTRAREAFAHHPILCMCIWWWHIVILIVFRWRCQRPFFLASCPTQKVSLAHSNMTLYAIRTNTYIDNPGLIQFNGIYELMCGCVA